MALPAEIQHTDLNEVTQILIKDLKDLRAGRITNTDARVRAQLGREILRSAHLQLEGLRLVQSHIDLLPDKAEEET